jgi:hypothetical protein
MVFGGMLVIADGGDLRMTFRIDDRRGAFRNGFTFQNTRNYRFTPEPLATSWQLRDVYDSLAEIEHSEWIDEIASSVRPEGRNRDLHHFMIYREDAGCLEVIAQGWERLEEVPWVAGEDVIPTRTK